MTNLLITHVEHRKINGSANGHHNLIVIQLGGNTNHTNKLAPQITENQPKFQDSSYMLGMEGKYDMVDIRFRGDLGKRVFWRN